MICSYIIFLYGFYKNDSYNFKGFLYLKKISKIKKIYIYNLKDIVFNEY